MDYFMLKKEDLAANSHIPIVTLGDAGEVFYEMALDMINHIKANNEAGKETVFICPVGPVGQYPIFVRLVNEQKVSLKKVWFFNMDEYLTDEDTYIDIDHRLSFRGFMNRTVYNQILPELVMPPEQRVFPDPANPAALDEKLAALGGAQVCYGGIGITGHLAFNEPETVPASEFAQRPTRILDISAETRAVNSIGDLGGAVAAMPRRCITIGMKSILAAKELRLYCFRDWHRAVVRQAGYGEISASFPVTLAQNHPDARITITRNVAEAAY
ncbi:MAG: glucosamine-6-phosphate isomerase [Treponema sp.]|nr:glucosamine-6-phosphate isomerase [Spirochaetia bacterium]MDD7275294.1 glucosamine-6-phosphate isomerase [Treponema sp.]MDY3755841.1 glucosamine-6-phosphate isomerase [Treponema sp.]MDY4673446.1 glucosamine-6-phosphate isomerase [Treponema sp.]